jgi:hypothetical protein
VAASRNVCRRYIGLEESIQSGSKMAAAYSKKCREMKMMAEEAGVMKAGVENRRKYSQ